MSGNSFTPLQTGFSRVFLLEGRARPDHAPSYETNARVTGPSQSFGDITKIEAPDPNNYGKFVEIGRVRGAVERATASIESRYAADLKSKLLRLANQGCPIDLQVHMGECTDPSFFSQFTKALIFEDVAITQWGGDDLGALASGDQNPVNETADISAREVYEVVPLSFTRKADSIISNEILAVIIADTLSCGDCNDESDGASKIFAITKAAGGSPSTPADVVYSLDKGVTWYAHDVDGLGTANDPNDLAAVGQYLVVGSSAGLALLYTTLSSFKAGSGDPTFTSIATGLVTNKGPRALASANNRLFVVGAGGYIYYTDDVTAGVTVLDAGLLTTSNYNDVKALASDFAVAVGDGGVVAYTTDGLTWGLATAPVGVGVNLLTVAVKSEREWFVGTNTGLMYYTVDGGVSWTLGGFSGSGSGTVQDIVISKDSVLYMSHTTTATKGRILRSFDGGHEWIVLPENSGTMVAVDRFTRLAASMYDPNFVVAVGLHDDGSDGAIVIGSN